MTRLTHLNALQALEATLRLGSLRLAAEEVGITPAALGQRIKSLEDYLDSPLLQRTRGGVAPTPATAEVLACLHEGFDQLSAVARGLKLDSPNTIHLAADRDWYECWLRPRLARLGETLPAIEVVVHPFSATPSHVGQTSDLVVEFSSPTAGGKRLFRDYLAPVVTSSVYHLYRDGGESNILENNALLHLDSYRSGSGALDWPGWFQLFGHRTRAFDRGIRYTSARNALDATLSSSGALLVGLALCLEDIERNRLCLLFDPEKGAWTHHAYHLYRGRESRPQVERFVRWLEAEAQASRSGLESLVGSHPSVTEGPLGSTSGE